MLSLYQAYFIEGCEYTPVEFTSKKDLLKGIIRFTYHCPDVYVTKRTADGWKTVDAEQIKKSVYQYVFPNSDKEKVSREEYVTALETGRKQQSSVDNSVLSLDKKTNNLLFIEKNIKERD